MKSFLPVRLLYFVAAAYDGLIGLVFLLDAPEVFRRAEITPPNHWGYVHFGAGVLVIFGYMFLRIALDPVENRNLITYGILLKICFVGTVAWHAFHGGIPPLWIRFAWADTAFAFLFIWSMWALRSDRSS
jgi:hypothetical protein